MTKDILLSISGLQIEVMEEEGIENEPIEVVTPASYFKKNGKHYILYDEVTEGISSITKNKVKISDTTVEIMKSGVTNVHMLFERGKKSLTYYETPYGQMLIGINTVLVEINESEENMDIRIEYELDINHEPLADCKIRMNIRSKNAVGFKLNEAMSD